MPDISTIGGGPSSVGVNAAATAGITLTSNASAHIKATGYTELIASTAYDSDWLMVQIGANGATGRFAVDIAVGASTAEQIIAPNLMYTTANIANAHDRNYLFPIRIPLGSRLSARCQANAGGQTINVAARVISTPIDAPPGMGRVESVGVVTSGLTQPTTLADPGGTAHTDGAWTQLIASTAFPYRWMCLTCCNISDTAYAAALSHLLDIGIGAAAAEVEVLSDLHVHGSTGTDHPSTGAVCFPVNIPSGVRVSARHRCSVTTTGDRRLDVAVWGCG
jgi:hypothetical protein